MGFIAVLVLIILAAPVLFGVFWLAVAALTAIGAIPAEWTTKHTPDSGAGRTWSGVGRPQ